MIKIESIKKAANGKYNIITEKGNYNLPEEVLIDLGLLKPKDLTEKEFKKMLEKVSFYNLYEKILNYLAFKMRTTKEVKDKLLALGASQATRDMLITRLTNEGYLNDDQYLTLYIKDKINLSNKGPNKLTDELVRLGLQKDKIRDELNKLPKKVWEEKAEKVIQKKLKTIDGKKSSLNIKQKLRQDFMMEGFPSEAYEPLLENLTLDDKSAQEKEEEKIRNKLAKKYTGKELDLRVKQKLYTRGFRDL